MAATAEATKPGFAADPQRRALTAKVHLAKKALGLNDDDYRAVLYDVTGKMSAADMTTPELTDVVRRFVERGFAASAPARGPTKAGAASRRPADHPLARKARALWISLHQLGVVANPSEMALEAFACRQLGCERLQWADQRLGYRLVEALKAMAERAGWSQDLSAAEKKNAVRALKLRLARAIFAQLVKAGRVPADWSIETAAFRLLGLEMPSLLSADIGDIDVVCAGLAAKK